MKKKPIQPEDKYVLRLPDGMRKRIKEAAERNGRSMNAEIVDRLDQSFSAFAQLEKVTLELKYAQLRERDLHSELAKAKANSEVTLGIPPFLQSRIEYSAKQNERSFTEELISALRNAYPKPKFLLGDLVELFEEVYGTDPERFEIGSQGRRVVEKMRETREMFETGEMSPNDEVSLEAELGPRRDAARDAEK